MHTTSAKGTEARIAFYKKTGKIHPRAVGGHYNTWRWAMVWFTQIIFYGACWLSWDGRQALLFDIAERKFYLFGLVLWPQDALLMALVLILSATGLFFVTALAGRLFCGFACPQTVYTSIYRWVEAKVEGDHLARLKLDQAPPSLRKVSRKSLKHLIWLAIAVWTGVTFVGYFTPIRELLPHLAAGALGPWEGFWVFFYAAFLYVQAGFAREAVCFHMCPYSRFQGVMFDRDTVTVAYDGGRGEPRSPRGKKAAREGVATAAAGDCVDCGLCVQVCPTGIDIRDGLQYQCINCGLCIDACDGVMRKIGLPTGLVRMASERALGSGPASGPATGAGRAGVALRNPRVWVYGLIMLLFTGMGIGILLDRTPLLVDVLRDRSTLSRETASGDIENGYTLKLMNMLERPRVVLLSVSGAPDIHIVGQTRFELPPGSVLPVPVTVAARPASGMRGAQNVMFRVEALDDVNTFVEEPASFFLPY